MPTLSRAGARVDGHNAWGSSIGFADVEPGGSYTAASEVLEGVPPLTFSVNGTDAFQDAGVDLDIHEEQDLVRCRDGDPMPLAEPGCGAFVPSGVRVERDIRQSRDGTLFEFETRFRSVDGQEHALDLLWTERFFDGHVPPSEPGFQFPGNGDAYDAHAAGDTIPAPDGAATIFVRTDKAAPDGDRRFAQGVVVYDGPIAGPIRFVSAPHFVVPMTFTVPAAGTVTTRTAYAQGTTRAGLEAVAKEFRDAWVDPPPAVTPPGPGAARGRPAGPPAPAARRRRSRRPLRRRAQRDALPRGGGADRDRRRHEARHRRAVRAQRGGEGVVRDRAGAARAARGREVPPADAREPPPRALHALREGRAHDHPVVAGGRLAAAVHRADRAPRAASRPPPDGRPRRRRRGQSLQSDDFALPGRAALTLH